MSNLKQIPNLFTLLNLAAGFIAIILCLQTGETILNQQDGEWKIYLPERIWWASVCIGIAAVIDFLDGFVARLTHTTSAIGKDLDSLADLVSFGLAPGILMFMTIELSLLRDPALILKKYQHFEFAHWDDFLSISSLSIPFFSLFRLAKFNNDVRQSDRFIGVPTPTNTIFFLFFPLLHWKE